MYVVVVVVVVAAVYVVVVVLTHNNGERDSRLNDYRKICVHKLHGPHRHYPSITYLSRKNNILIPVTNHALLITFSKIYETE